VRPRYRTTRSQRNSLDGADGDGVAVDFAVPERAARAFVAEVFPEAAALVLVEVAGDEVED
jgi:hypothetical protein